ncbi:MAG TPA: glycosyltransferase family 2 protein [Longimicrobium sp.]|jgi:glycosyltransferase involved in cell wall biosynthesis|nr:glycosyltransferase family 2 protein [Longimicrobium sp.]
MAEPRVSVVVTTYNQPRQLELVLHGYAVQDDAEFEVVVADDGSGPETRAVVERMRAETGLRILHVWHEDRGFRKTEILNRAILAATGDYLLFTDGDCIPRSDLIATHARLARRGRFLSGGYLKLPADVTAAIGVDDVREMRVADPAWLREHGWRGGRHALRLTRSPLLAAALDAATPTRPTWNGHNASGWKEDLLAVNGYDTDMAYGGLDRALGERLENAGIRGLQARFRAPVLHLHHERPYVDPQKVKRNREFRARIRRDRIVRAPMGIAELQPDPTLRVDG